MSSNIISKAVEPLKADAIEHAASKAKASVDQIVKKYNGTDLNAIRPRSTMSRADYKAAQQLHGLATRVLNFDRSTRNVSDPVMAKGINLAGVEKYLASVREEAGASFDAYVAKLAQKVGECDAAKVDGNQLWFGSVLTVTKGDKIERWKTQQIVNVSALGTLFNQWPTRLMK